MHLLPERVVRKPRGFLRLFYKWSSGECINEIIIPRVPFARAIGKTPKYEHIGPITYRKILALAGHKANNFPDWANCM